MYFFNKKIEVLILDKKLKSFLLKIINFLKKLKFSKKKDTLYSNFHVSDYKYIENEIDEPLIKEGIKKIREKNFKDAVDCFQKSVSKDRNNFIYHSLLAEALCLDGNFDLARDHNLTSGILKLKSKSKKDDIMPILFSSLPKSGSLYLNNFFRGLKMKKTSIAFPSDTVASDTIHTGAIRDFATSPNNFAHHHLPATETNVNRIIPFLSNFFVLVRDPRQATISMTHHISRSKNIFHNVFALKNIIKNDYFKLSFEEQLDWQIKHGYFNRSLEFINGWLKVRENKNLSKRLLLLTLEELVNNKKAFFNKIADFFSIKKYYLPQQPNFQPSTHFRLGKINEWKELLNEEQKRITSKMITKSMREYFFWD